MANIVKFGDFLNTNNQDYRWWVGEDGNLWANVEGRGVMNLGEASGLGAYANQGQAQNLDPSKQISDPNVQASNPSNGSIITTTTTSSSNGSNSASDTALKKRMIGIYDRQIGDINNNLDSLQSQLDNELEGIKNEYNTYKNEQQSSYDANKNDYEKNTLQNKQNLRANRNEITDRASKGLRGLLRILGAMGASGGSEARYEIPQMVTDQANAEFSNAGQTFAQNQQSLDTDWNNYTNQFENDKKKLEDWYNGQVKAKKQVNYEKGQSLLADLVTAYGNRAQYGGDYGGNVENAYNRIADYRSKINDLGKFTPTEYTGMTAVYKAPDLATYNTGNTNLSTTVTDSNTSATSPLLTALKGLNKKKTNSPYSNIMED